MRGEDETGLNERQPQREGSRVDSPSIGEGSGRQAGSPRRWAPFLTDSERTHSSLALGPHKTQTQTQHEPEDSSCPAELGWGQRCVRGGRASRGLKCTCIVRLGLLCSGDPP